MNAALVRNAFLSTSPVLLWDFASWGRRGGYISIVSLPVFVIQPQEAKIENKPGVKERNSKCAFWFAIYRTIGRLKKTAVQLQTTHLAFNYPNCAEGARKCALSSFYIWPLLVLCSNAASILWLARGVFVGKGPRAFQHSSEGQQQTGSHMQPWFYCGI